MGISQLVISWPQTHLLVNKEKEDAGVQPRPQGRGHSSLVAALIQGRVSIVVLSAGVRREEGV